jgi:hypothetical protein
MFRTLLAAAFLAIPAVAVAGGEGKTAPKGPPPQVMILQVERDGTQYIVHTTTEMVPEQRAEKVKVGDKEVTRVRTVYVQVSRPVAVRLDGKDVQVFDATGKRLTGVDIPKFLKPVPVLVSADGKPVDPLYLRLARPETLVVVAPALAGRSGAVMPVPLQPLPMKTVPVPPNPR